MRKIRKVTLRESRTKNDYSVLEAYINKDGDLVMEGYDIGETPEKFWGDSDYEYGRVIKGKYKNKVLSGLIEDQFSVESDFKAWLDSKRVPRRSSGMVKNKYRDTVMLLLIKERFDSASDFKDWLVSKDIPDKYWSWI